MPSLAVCPSGAWRVMEGLPMYPQNPMTARLRNRLHPSKEQNHPVRQSDPVRARSSRHNNPHHPEGLSNSTQKGRPASAHEIYQHSKTKFKTSTCEYHHLYKLESGEGAISPMADIFVPSHHHSSSVSIGLRQRSRPTTATRPAPKSTVNSMNITANSGAQRPSTAVRSVVPQGAQAPQGLSPRRPQPPARPGQPMGRTTRNRSKHPLGIDTARVAPLPNTYVSPPRHFSHVSATRPSSAPRPSNVEVPTRGPSHHVHQGRRASRLMDEIHGELRATPVAAIAGRDPFGLRRHVAGSSRSRIARRTNAGPRSLPAHVTPYRSGDSVISRSTYRTGFGRVYGSELGVELRVTASERARIGGVFNIKAKLRELGQRELARETAVRQELAPPPIIYA